MKKINLLLASLLMLASVTFAQDTIWSDDFSTPANWSITHGSGTTADWVIGTAGPTGTKSKNMGSITSTSGGNFALFDSDALGGTFSSLGPLQNAFLATKNAIDLSTYEGAILHFESYYARWITSYIYVEVSTDGTAWVEAKALCESTASCGLGVTPPDNISDNPTKMSINLTSLVAKQATVWIRFRFVETMGVGNYAWMIDDVVLIAPPANSLNLKMVNHNGVWNNFGKQATYIPKVQITKNPLNFEGLLENEGTNAQTNAKLHVNILNGTTNVFSETSSAGTIAKLSEDALFVTSTYTPPSTGLYKISMWATSDSIASTDTITSNLYVTDTILGKDEDNRIASFHVTGCNYEVGNVFTMYENQKVSSISIYVGPNSKEGADIKGTVYDYFDLNTTPSEVVSTPSYYLTGPDTLGGWITLRFLANVELTAGSTYLVAAANITADAFIGLSGKSVAPEEVIYYNVGGCSNCSGELCVLESVPMVRLNFEYPVGIGEEMINLGVSVYPNPANDGQFSINFSNAKKDVYSLEMKNMLGQVVYAENLNIQGSIVKQVDVKQLRKGVYFLNINNSNTTGTQKIVIN